MANVDAAGRETDLPKQVYLMAYNLWRRRLYDRTRTAFLVHAAALIECALRGLVVDDVDVIDATARESDDPVLDAVLARVAAHHGRWTAWNRHNPRPSLVLLETRLISQGVVTMSTGGFGRRRITVTNETEVFELQRAVRFVLLGDSSSTAVLEPRMAALGLLAMSGSVRHVLARKDVRNADARVAELASWLDAAAYAPVSRVTRGLGVTILAAQGGIGGS